MATNKNITMKQFNGTDYDTLYPKTIASQIPDVYSKSETYPKSQLYTRSQLYTQSQLYTRSQIDGMINPINNALNGKAQIQTGSYVGTGTYGENNPCSLTFDFVPKLLIFFNKDCNGLFLTDGYSEVGYIGIVNLTTLTTSYTQGGVVSSSFSDYDGDRYSTINGYSLKSSNGKTIKWYCKGSKSGFTYPRIAKAQLNENNITYYYMGVG